jgi:hypothetical protein
MSRATADYTSLLPILERQRRTDILTALVAGERIELSSKGYEPFNLPLVQPAIGGAIMPSDSVWSA